ncbi:MAG: baseplate J/gp47 family protein [Fluviibacter sp.]
MTLYQVNYTSRDYDAIRQELINVVNYRIPEWTGNDTSDFALALVESFAYVGDLLSYYVDRSANEAAIQTASQRKSLLNFAEVAGYKPSGPTPAQATFQITNKSATASINLPVGTQIKVGLPSGPVSYCYFETTAAISSLAPLGVTTVTAIEGNTAHSVDTGTQTIIPTTILQNPSGYAYTDVTIYETGIVDGSITVYTGEGTSFKRWTYVENIVEYGPYDLVYSTKLTEDGYTTITFGDNINGAIPTDSISATYRTSVGVSGNLPDPGNTSVAQPISFEISFIPCDTSNQKSSISVVNTTAGTGGSDGENMRLLRKNIIKAMSARNRAVTLKDYENLAVLVPNVGKASAVASVYTSVSVYFQPYNDGTSTPGLVSGVPTPSWTSTQAKLDAFLSGRCPVNTTVTVLPPTYKSVVLSLTVNIASSFKQRDVKLAIARNLIDSKVGVFSYNGLGFGDDVTQSLIIAILMSTPGVLSASLGSLYVSGGSGVGDISIAAGEIPILTSSNLTINVNGGIS